LSICAGVEDTHAPSIFSQSPAPGMVGGEDVDVLCSDVGRLSR